MTRYARAKGSKASNERITEEATPWGQMKDQLINKQKEIVENEKRKEFDRKRKQNYDAFLNEVKEKRTGQTEWAEIPLTNGFKSKDVDDRPVEVSSKIEPPQIVLKKAKTSKKPLLKIVVNKEEKAKEETHDVAIKPKKDNKKKKSKDNGEWSESVPEIVKGEKKTKKIKPKEKVIIEEKPEVNVEEREQAKKEKRKKEKSKLKEKLVIQKKVPFDSLPEEIQKKIMRKREKKQRQLDLKRLNKKAGKNSDQAPEGKSPKKPAEASRKFPQNREKKSKEGEAVRRKEFNEKVVINGKEVELKLFNGFPVKKEDAEQLTILKKQLISKGLPRSEIEHTLKLERRKAEKALARERKKVCFNCRKFGHNLSECPDLDRADELVAESGAGVCFKCGSTEHTHYECKVVRGPDYKFATCFVCGEQGHISKQCPDNARGLYPKGGSCRVCGDVTHLKKDCPKYQAQQQKEGVSVDVFQGGNPDNLDGTFDTGEKATKRPNKIIKF